MGMISSQRKSVHKLTNTQILPSAIQVLVRTTGGATYTAEQLPQLLADLGLHQQAAVFPTVRKLNELDRADFQARPAS